MYIRKRTQDMLKRPRFAFVRVVSHAGVLAALAPRALLVNLRRSSPGHGAPSPAGMTSAFSPGPAIDLSAFDEEEFEALYSGEWGVGWRLNERAINMRQVIAQSLMEFLGIVEPENSIVLGG